MIHQMAASISDSAFNHWSLLIIVLELLKITVFM